MSSPLTTPSVERSSRFLPRADVFEGEDHVMLHLDLPGADVATIDVRAENGVLSIHAPIAPRQPEGTAYRLHEYGVGAFTRTFNLGESIDASKIEAEYRDGVLSLRLPRVVAAQPKKIAVRRN